MHGLGADLIVTRTNAHPVRKVKEEGGVFLLSFFALALAAGDSPLRGHSNGQAIQGAPVVHITAGGRQ